MTQCSDQAGTMGQCTLLPEPGRLLDQDTPPLRDSEAGPSPGPSASTSFSLELLATLGAEGHAYHP